MRRLLVPLLCLLAACSTTGEPPPPLALAALVPSEVTKALGDTVELSGEGLERVTKVSLEGAKTVELELVAPGEKPKVKVPAGLSAGRYDVHLETGDGEKATKAAALSVIDGELQIEVANIGQGDGGYVRAPNGRTLVIDGGRARTAGGADSLKPILEKRGIVSPEFILVSHFDADHLGGIVDFMRGPDGKTCTPDDRAPSMGLIDYAPEWNTCASDLCADYYALRDCNAERIASGAGWRVAAPGDEIPLGAGVKVKVVAVNGKTEATQVPTGSDNSNSIALLVEFGSFRYFTAGDLTGGPPPGCNVGGDTADVETPVAEAVGKVDVLHVNHHGSCTSTNPAFLRALSPKVALVSVGENNAYGHPHQEVVDRIGAAGTRLFLTSPGITEAGNFPKTRLPSSAEPSFGHLRVRTQDGRGFQVDVVDAQGRELASRSFTAGP